MTTCCLILLALLQAGLLAAETNAVATAHSRNDFESFRVIAQRNIFNPNRSARGSRSDNGEPSKSARSESFALVGTMLYDDRQFAFFDSSDSNYKKVLKVGDSIAGFKINEVAPSGVKLEAGDKKLEVAVGQQLKRLDQGEWSVTGKAAAETPSSSASSSASSADEDEAVKRLMKKREEEMNK